MLKSIIKLNVALHAAKAATFGRKIAPTWHERYLRQYVYMSLKRPNSHFLLTGNNNYSKWFPSGPGLLATTGVIQWSNSSYKPIANPESTHINFKHANQTDLLMNHHSDHKDNRSRKELLEYFENLKKSNQLHVFEIDLNEDENYQEILVVHEDANESIKLGKIAVPESKE